MKPSKIQGIYAISNLKTDDVYIGSSRDMRSRWLEHRTALDKGRHHNIPLQAAWEAFGQEAFSFEVIEQTDLLLLAEREQAWIDRSQPSYNRAMKVTRSESPTGIDFRLEVQATRLLEKSPKPSKQAHPVFVDKDLRHLRQQSFELKVANYGTWGSEETEASLEALNDPGYFKSVNLLAKSVEGLTGETTIVRQK